MPAKKKALERTPDGTLYVGSLIRSIIDKEGIDVRILAQSIGYTTAVIRGVETNNIKPSTRFLKSFCKATGYSFSELQKAPLHPRVLERMEEAREQARHTRKLVNTIAELRTQLAKYEEEIELLRSRLSQR